MNTGPWDRLTRLRDSISSGRDCNAIGPCTRVNRTTGAHHVHEIRANGQANGRISASVCAGPSSRGSPWHIPTNSTVANAVLIWIRGRSSISTFATNIRNRRRPRVATTSRTRSESRDAARIASAPDGDRLTQVARPIPGDPSPGSSGSRGPASSSGAADSAGRNKALVREGLHRGTSDWKRASYRAAVARRSRPPRVPDHLTRSTLSGMVWSRHLQRYMHSHLRHAPRRRLLCPTPIPTRVAGPTRAPTPHRQRPHPHPMSSSRTSTSTYSEEGENKVTGGKGFYEWIKD
jgi:hypothetical protein